jgi:hypothetical protein
MRLGDLLFGVSFSVDQDTSMSVEADSRIGAWLDGVSAPRMPWLTAATRHGCGVNLHEHRFNLVCLGSYYDCWT